MSSLIRISDISLYLRCPRLIYFDALGSLPRKISPEQLLLRSLMLSISLSDSTFSGSDIEASFRSALSRLEQELPLVYEIDPTELNQACREMEGRIPELACGFAPYINLLFPSEVEVDLRSNKLGLSGRLDRLITRGRVPSMVRTGSAPEDGVWKKDRLMLTGYALLLAEKNGERVSRGFVEYPRSAVVREVEIHAVDRSRVLRIRDRVRQIKEGQLPDRPEDARCDGCEVKERCETRHSLASKFF
jgi:CRISPR-associated exonuclease Cas4